MGGVTVSEMARARAIADMNMRTRILSRFTFNLTYRKKIIKKKLRLSIQL